MAHCRHDDINKRPLSTLCRAVVCFCLVASPTPWDYYFSKEFRSLGVAFLFGVGISRFLRQKLFLGVTGIVQFRA